MEEEPVGTDEVGQASLTEAGDPVPDHPPGERHHGEVDEDLGDPGPGVLHP